LLLSLEGEAGPRLRFDNLGGVRAEWDDMERHRPARVPAAMERGGQREIE